MFVDNEVSVIILETSHRAIDIANSNKDLNGRIGHIEIGSWSIADLQSICHQGMNYLQQKMPRGVANFISKEAVGLPIIVQQICLEFFKQRNIVKINEVQNKKIEFTSEETKKCMHVVAKSRLNHLEAHYNMLVSGPREKARKYRTYELVLACFARDPIKFALKRFEIEARIGELSLQDGERPPVASINSTLGALEKFQTKRKLEILEWQAQEHVLYMLQPEFLFFIRWRQMRATKPEQLDFLHRLLAIEVIKSKDGKLFFQPRVQTHNQ